MISGRAVICGDVGLHARPAADFVRHAERFRSKVRVARDGMWVNGKSILALLTLAAEKGTELQLEVDGPDEQEAFPVLKGRLEQRDA